MRNEHIRAELSKLKQLTFKKKLGYIWDYYKPVLAVILGIIFVISIVVQIIMNGRITTELTVGFFNSTGIQKDMDTLAEEFAEVAKLNGSNQEVIFDATYLMDLDANDSMTIGTQTKVMAMISAGTMDVMLMPEEIYRFYLNSGMFMDLKQLLSTEEYIQCQDVFMMDKNEEDTVERAYGLSLEQNEKVSDIFPYEEVILCVVANTTHENNARQFVKYLLSQS